MDALKQFAQLRQALTQEREQIQECIREIDAALGGYGVRAQARSSSTRRTVRHGSAGTARHRKERPHGQASIREAVMKVTSARPLTVREIVSTMQKTGYRFASKEPVNSVGAFLYSARGRRHFTNKDGKFRPKI